MLCPKCGAEMQPEMRFCPDCGYKPTLLERMQQGSSLQGYTAANRPKPFRLALSNVSQSTLLQAAQPLFDAIGVEETARQDLLNAARADSLWQKDRVCALLYALHLAGYCCFASKHADMEYLANQLNLASDHYALPAVSLAPARYDAAAPKGWHALAELALGVCPYAIVGLDEGEQDFFFFPCAHEQLEALKAALIALCAAAEKRATAVTDWTRLTLA